MKMPGARRRSRGDGSAVESQHDGRVVQREQSLTAAALIRRWRGSGYRGWPPSWKRTSASGATRAASASSSLARRRPEPLSAVSTVTNSASASANACSTPPNAVSRDRPRRQPGVPSTMPMAWPLRTSTPSSSESRTARVTSAECTPAMASPMSRALPTASPSASKATIAARPTGIETSTAPRRCAARSCRRPARR